MHRDTEEFEEFWSKIRRVDASERHYFGLLASVAFVFLVFQPFGESLESKEFQKLHLYLRL